MKKRIGLFSPAPQKKKKGGPSTSTSYVEVENAAELAAELTTRGAKRVGLLCKDRLGSTRMEGAMFTVADLKDQHIEWVMAKAPQFETRAIYYDPN
jgi:hypothetical protein